MNKHVFSVVKFEIMRQLKKPAFWATTLLLPALIGGIYFISFMSSRHIEENPTLDENVKVAITDDAGILSAGAPFVINGDEEYGKEMIKNGEVDLYYYIPKDFLETKKVNFYHVSEGLEIFNNDGNIIKGLLMQDVASRVGDLNTLVLTGNYEVVDNKLTKDGEEANALGKAIIPFFIGIAFFMFIVLCGNRFLMTVVEEKENRISELVLTSVSSKHLIVGKIIAMLALGLIQIAALVIPILIIVFLNRDNQFISTILSMIEVEPVSIIMSLLLFVSSAVFYAGACTFVGSLVPTARDASSFIGPVIVMMVFPLYFMQMFMMAEPSLIVQILTYFPFSAPVALMLRSGFGTITNLEFLVGIIIMAISAVIIIKMAILSFQKNAINFEVVKLKLLRKKAK